MEPQAEYKKTAEKDVKKFVSQWKMPPEVELAANSLDEMMGEELGALGEEVLFPTDWRIECCS